MNQDFRSIIRQPDGILISLLILSVIVKYALKETDLSVFVSIFQTLLMAGLLVYYMIKSPEWFFRIIFAGLLIGLLPLLSDQLNINLTTLSYAGTLANVVAGVFFIIKALKESRKNKNFEMMTFLCGIFLLLPLAISFASLAGGAEVQQLVTIFHFGLCFVIGTLMYYENLWEKFSLSQKNFLTYTLVVALFFVLGKI